MKKRFYFLCVAACWVFQSAYSVMAQTQDTLFSRLIGGWRGEGKVMGMESRLQMKWERVLDGKFVRLTFRNEMRGRQGTQVFEGHGYYQAKPDGDYLGQWFDSGGEAHSIRGKVESDALIANWGTKETKLGQTVYRFLTENSIEVIDSILSKDGQWKEFGRSKFTRE